jgi:transposase
MINDIINLLFLNHVRSKIEQLETRYEGLHLWVELKFKKEDLKCPICSSQTRFHDYQTKRITHSVSTIQTCFINYKARRYRCNVCNKRFIEDNPFLAKYESISLLTKMNVLEHLKNPSHTFTSAANAFHISIQSVINIFDAHIEAKRRTLPEIISLDEFYKSKGSKYKYACLLYDFKDKKVIDVLTTRHKRYLIDFFSRIPKYETEKVKYFIIDMWEPYREAIHLAFPKAKIAVDSFHIIKELNQIVTRIRIEVMNRYKLSDRSLITNDSYYYMLKKFSYFFVKDFDKIKTKKIVIPKFQTAWDKHTILDYLLSIDDTLKRAYQLKEQYREFNKTADYHTCDEEFDALIQRFRNHELEAFRMFGKTLMNWKTEIKCSFIRVNGKRLSNGPIEGVNSQVKTIIKSSAGIKDFFRLRNKIMFSINKDIPVLSRPKKRSKYKKK